MASEIDARRTATYRLIFKGILHAARMPDADWKKKLSGTFTATTRTEAEEMAGLLSDTLGYFVGGGDAWVEEEGRGRPWRVKFTSRGYYAQIGS